MSKVRRYYQWLWLFLLLFIGATVVYIVDNSIRKQEFENRQIQLNYVHNRAINQFSAAIDNFATLVSSMRSYVNLSPEIPSSAELQTFVRNHFNDLDKRDSIVVSYIDTSHVFRYSFTLGENDPAGLVGTKVAAIRSSEKINRLDSLMNSDELQMMPPINLVEGWLGIPINFRVQRDSTTLGYIAPLINFKTIIQSVYDPETSNNFVFHFSTEDGHDLDRERIYDGNAVYNNSMDPEYFGNFDIAASNMVYTDLNYYGFNIRIGTGFKQQFVQDKRLRALLYTWLLTYAIFILIVTIQFSRFKSLNIKLMETNELLERRRREIRVQNNKLIQLNQTKNKFFSIIGHDIRQPLGAIEGLLTLLKDEKIRDPKLKYIVQQLASSTNNTVNLLNNLLRWALAQTGDIEFVPSEIELNDLIYEAIETYQPRAIEKEIYLGTKLELPITITGDRDMLSTVFRNLISNAIKFTRKGGKVMISSLKTENSVIISVKDNGIGMTPEQLRLVFNISGRSSQIGTMGEIGTGLGLFLCKDFVEKHKGTIAVESQEEVGTTFLIELPL